MGHRYIKRADSIDILYEGYKRETGLTVEGNFYKPSGVAYAGNPYSFTHLANGVYKLSLSATSDDGWHVGDIDATDSGKSRPGSMMFQVAANSVQDIYNKANTIESKVDAVQADVDAANVTLADIQGAGFVSGTDSLKVLSDVLDDIKGTSFSTSTDSLYQIKQILNTINTTLNGVEGAVHTTIHLDEQMVIPTSGNVRYQVDVRNYSNTGMKDFDAAPTVAVVDSLGNTLTTRLYNAASGGIQTATMAQVGGSGSGHYRLFFQVADTDTVRNLYFVVSGTEDSEAFTYQKNSELSTDILAAGLALEATLTTMKQTTGGTFNRDTDSLEALRDRLDAGLGATFDTATDSLEKIRDEIKGVIRFSGLGAH